MRKPALIDALFTSTQQRVMGLLFGQPEREFGTVELIKLANAGRGAVQRELARLQASELVTVNSAHGQRRYRANHAAPIFDELRSIVLKTIGVPDVLRRVLEPLSDKLDLAILYGSIAKHSDTARSDVDVLIVSDELSLEDLYRTLEGAEVELGRRVSPTLYTIEEFESRLENNLPFLSNVLGGPHVMLLGSLNGNRTTR